MYFPFLLYTLFIVIIYINCVLTTDLAKWSFWTSGIYTVDNGQHYFERHPDANMTSFFKTTFAKGTAVFTAGDRVEGDHTAFYLANMDSFNKEEDIEIRVRYPRSGLPDGLRITRVVIYALGSSELVDAYFLKGGINYEHCDILLTSNHTTNFGYEIYLYGY